MATGREVLSLWVYYRSPERNRSFKCGAELEMENIRNRDMIGRILRCTIRDFNDGFRSFKLH